MTNEALPRRARLTDRWPTALALVATAGALAVIILFDREQQYFGPAVATMAAIYLVAYAAGRPWSAWPAFVGLSAIVTALQFMHTHGVVPFDAAVGMSIVLVLLWLWSVARRRYADAPTFSVQTAGMVGFGALTLIAAAVEPRWGVLLAGIGFLAHGAWDVYHFRANKVVNRPWSEFCAVVDGAVGVALVIVAIA
jgi:hypothetical protein